MLLMKSKLQGIITHVVAQKVSIIVKTHDVLTLKKWTIKMNSTSQSDFLM